MKPNTQQYTSTFSMKMFTKQICCCLLFVLIEFSHCRSDEYTSTQSPYSAGQNLGLEELKNTISALNQRLESFQIQNTQCGSIPRNCQEVLERGQTTSGIYKIRPNFAKKEISVLCDMKRHGGGWTYFLHRLDGSQDFYLDWKSYKEGFGKIDGEFWLGLENIHLLTGFDVNQLLLELVDWDNKKVYGLYDLFLVGSEKEGYPLKYLQGYTGDDGDMLSHQLGMKFTTKDKDQDIWKDDNCGTFSRAGWWYRDCKRGHPTGVYLGQHFDGKNSLTGIFWDTFHGNTYSLKEVRLMVRPHRPVKTTPAP